MAVAQIVDPLLCIEVEALCKHSHCGRVIWWKPNGVKGSHSEFTPFLGPSPPDNPSWVLKALTSQRHGLTSWEVRLILGRSGELLAKSGGLMETLQSGTFFGSGRPHPGSG